MNKYKQITVQKKSKTSTSGHFIVEPHVQKDKKQLFCSFTFSHPLAARVQNLKHQTLPLVCTFCCAGLFCNSKKQQRERACAPSAKGLHPSGLNSRFGSSKRRPVLPPPSTDLSQPHRLPLSCRCVRTPMIIRIALTSKVLPNPLCYQSI